MSKSCYKTLKSNITQLDIYPTVYKPMININIGNSFKFVKKRRCVTSHSHSRPVSSCIPRKKRKNKRKMFQSNPFIKLSPVLIHHNSCPLISIPKSHRICRFTNSYPNILKIEKPKNKVVRHAAVTISVFAYSNYNLAPFPWIPGEENSGEGDMCFPKTNKSPTSEVHLVNHNFTL